MRDAALECPRQSGGGHESKNDCIDYGAVLCRSGSVLRRRKF
jgi:hypothetical protein